MLQIDRVRLNLKAAAGGRRSTEEEVLHYQWFADLGNTDAARAVGQMLSSGAMRDPSQALRYFRRAPPESPRALGPTLRLKSGVLRGAEWTKWTVTVP